MLLPSMTPFKRRSPARYADLGKDRCGYDGPCGAYATIGSCPIGMGHRTIVKSGRKGIVA